MITNVKRKIEILFLILILILTSDAARFRGRKRAKGTKEAELNAFIVPLTLSPNEDSFIYKQGKEIIVVNKHLEWKTASLYCQKQHEGHLVYIETEEEAFFIAEALSEVNAKVSELWVGARRDTEEPDRWHWVNVKERNYKEVDELMLEDYLIVRKNKKDDNSERDCLSFSRKLHLTPFFVDLGCDILRPFICQREAFRRTIKDPIHPDWIPLGMGVYKIFPEEMTYEGASMRCLEEDREATLAIVPSTSVANALGRYLLIGRPSLGSAWIGGRWDDKSRWSFHSNGLHIPEVSVVGKDGLLYPPWPQVGKLRLKGCILLVRDTFNSTLFVPSRCERLKPFICYKPLKHLLGVGITDFPDVHGYDYRLYRNKAPWDTAKQTCIEKGGKLAEPENPKDIEDYIVIMGENRTAIDHMWIGGKHIPKAGWTYASRDKKIPRFNTTVWIENSTYVSEIEEDNTCLNIDRENHNNALLYGTICYYPQVFLCQWDAGRMPNEREAKKAATEVNVNGSNKQVTKTTTSNAIVTNTSDANALRN